MAVKPISTPLPADLPETWQTGQTVAPTGAEVGLSEQHGYNYLMEQVNAAQEALNTINNAFEDLATLGSDGKVPLAQLAGVLLSVSAAAEYSASATYSAGDYCVHEGQLYKASQDIDTAEAWTAAHWTAVSIMAELATAVAGLVSKSGDTMTGNLVGPQFIANNNLIERTSTHWIDNYPSAIINNKLDDNNYSDIIIRPETEPLIRALEIRRIINGEATYYQVYHTGNKPTAADVGATRIETGSYVGTGTYGQDNPTTITFPFTPKLVFVYAPSDGIMGQAGSDFIGVTSRSLIWWMPGITRQTLYGSDDTQLNFLSSNNALSYYMTTSASGWGAEWQFNFSGKTYNWIALG